MAALMSIRVSITGGVGIRVGDGQMAVYFLLLLSIFTGRITTRTENQSSTLKSCLSPVGNAEPVVLVVL